MSEYSLLVKNLSKKPLTIYFYYDWDPICWISRFSKIVLPGREFLQRGTYKFKYELYSEKKKIQPIQKWNEDNYIEITGNGQIIKDDLDNHETEKTIIFQHDDFKKNKITKERGFDLYDILGLQMKEVRSKSLDEQTKIIKDARDKQLKKYHPDKPNGNERITKEVIMAYDILQDVTQRMKYHNEYDYNGGWFSWSRWKSIYKPDDINGEAKLLKKRLNMTLGSVSKIIGGLLVLAGTGGSATLAPMLAGSIVGFGLMGGGTSSLMRSLNQECSWSDWGTSSALGMVAGGLTGGVAGGAMAGVAGIGTTIGAATIGQQTAIGAITASAGGVFQSVASDMERNLVDGEDVGWREVTAHAACGGVIGAATGAVGGYVSGKVGGVLASTNLDEVVEQAVIRRYAPRALGAAIESAAEGGVGRLCNTTINIIDERIDDEQENRPIGEHIIDGFTALGGDIVMGAATGMGETNNEDVIHPKAFHRTPKR